MEEKVVRKTTARKVVRKTVARKAPTQVAEGEVRQTSQPRSKLPLIAIGVFIVIVGASVAVGFSDSGQINVESTINNRRIHGTEEEKQALESIPVQRARPSAPNGGLVPTSDPDPGAPAPTPVETASTTGTSTEESAEGTETTEGDSEGEPAAEEPARTEEVPAEAEATEPPTETAPAPETPAQ